MLCDSMSDRKNFAFSTLSFVVGDTLWIAGKCPARMSQKKRLQSQEVRKPMGSACSALRSFSAVMPSFIDQRSCQDFLPAYLQPLGQVLGPPPPRLWMSLAGGFGRLCGVRSTYRYELNEPCHWKLGQCMSI